MTVVGISMLHIEHPLRLQWLRPDGLNRIGFGLDWIPLDYVALNWMNEPASLATLVARNRLQPFVWDLQMSFLGIVP